MRSSIVRLKPNLQWTRVGAARVKACTRCIKTKSKVAKTA